MGARSPRRATCRRSARLLKHGAALGAEDKFGKTALHVACEQGHAEVIDVILGYAARLPGGRAAAPCATAAGALQLAARFDFVGICRALIASGARVDAASDHDGRTALHAARRERGVRSSSSTRATGPRDDLRPAPDALTSRPCAGLASPRCS